MAAKNIPRGIRNNNPGNIERDGDKWQGLSEAQTDPRFCNFSDATWGIRALAVLLINYQDKHGLRTIKDVINRWAPPKENITTAYVKAVTADVATLLPDVTTTSRIDLHDYKTLKGVVSGIINHENGDGGLTTLNTWYPDSVIDEALRRAGVVSAKPKVVTTTTTTAAITAGLGVDQLVQIVPQVTAAVNSSRDDLTSGDWMRIAIGVFMVGSAIALAIHHVRQQKLATA